MEIMLDIGSIDVVSVKVVKPAETQQSVSRPLIVIVGGSFDLLWIRVTADTLISYVSVDIPVGVLCALTTVHLPEHESLTILKSSPENPTKRRSPCSNGRNDDIPEKRIWV